MAVKWLDEPQAHDYDAAATYLSMLAEKATVDKTVAALKSAVPTYQAAKDILRAARLVLLPKSNAHVRADLAKISNGKKLSPILLVRGSEVLSAYVPGPRGPVFMTLIERSFGKAVTTRTWDTVQKIARAGAG